MTEFTCIKCDICSINNHRPLLGDGNKDANIMFITRNPSAFEVKKDVPLFSKDGMLFQKFLDLFNFHRDNIFITNAVKCKTPGHRYPTDLEIYNCREHLENEIKQVNPRIVVIMGNTALRSYFKLAFKDTIIDINTINACYMPHNGRVILFIVSPAYALKSYEGRLAMYYSFVSLLRLYRIINPMHEINFNM